MEPVDKAVCEAKCKVMDERFARDLRDIDDCKIRLQKIEELTIKMGELVEANQKAVEDHDSRLCALSTARPCGGISCSQRASPQVWRR